LLKKASEYAWRKKHRADIVIKQDQNNNTLTIQYKDGMGKKELDKLFVINKSAMNKAKIAMQSGNGSSIGDMKLGLNACLPFVHKFEVHSL